jgi:hypothetical protein
MQKRCRRADDIRMCPVTDPLENVPSAAALLEQGLPIPTLANALPDFVLAAAYGCAWWRPGLLPAGVARSLIILLLMEFIVLHSAAFMGAMGYGDAPRATRVRQGIGLGVFYSLFVLGFSLGFHTWWPMLSFWLLTANRLGGVLLRRSGDGAPLEILRRGWAGTTVCYLLAVGVATILPWPRGGVDDAAKSALALTGGGQWIDAPWHAFAAGLFYYSLVAMNELNGWRAFRARASVAPATATPAR